MKLKYSNKRRQTQHVFIVTDVFSMQWLHVSTNNYVIFRPFNT
jgi:hypothetical protein